MNASKDRQGAAGSVRIIGGSWRRRRIAVPISPGMRPTPDRVRESLFNWIAPVLPGAVCLDLFAGTGALGLEALSRGAEQAVLVEHDRAAAAALTSVCDEFGANARVVCADASDYLSHSAPAAFDLVFVDPPYTRPVDDVLATLLRLLRPGAQVYLERSRDGPWPDAPNYNWRKRSTAGAVAYGLATVD
jgi:16S rRNA (guanine966-N2)-methyltransferase